MDIFWRRDLTKVQLRGLELEESGSVSPVNALYETYTFLDNTIMNRSMQERCKPFANLPFTALFKLEGREGCYCGTEDKTMKKLCLDRWSNKTGFFPSVLLGKANSILFALY
jgi:hypothetical protein